MNQVEVAHLRMALDLLGVALTEHNHTWTTLERHAYETAQRILTPYADPAKVDEERQMIAERHSG